MDKRRVPAALHHELSEYAALLRALRVRDAMDVTKHLTKPSPFALQDDELNWVDDDSNASQPSATPVAGPSDLNHPANAPVTTKSTKAKGKQPADSHTPAAKQRRRDHWTRWPLPLPDVLLPEWTLEDEVAFIASQVIQSRPPLVFSFSADQDIIQDDDEDDEQTIHVMDMEHDSDDPDPPYYVPYLTSIVAHYLSTLLAILASHTPARPASMQNRIEPLNWRAVIDVVVSCGVPEFANSKVVENVIKRMEAIYGPSISPLEGKKATSFRAVERMKEKELATEIFEKLFEEEDVQYFTGPSPPHYRSPSPPPPQKLKLNRTARKEEADYKARKRWTRKDPIDKVSKAKGKNPKTTKVASAEVNADLSLEKEQPVRRSKRARTSVSYREVPPHSDDIEE